MSIKYSTNGNLALTVYNGDKAPHFTVIDCTQTHEPIHRQIIDQIFADVACNRAYGAEAVAAALSNAPGRQFLKSKQDRIFAAAASSIGTFALFYFSFFAF